jgi:hypothetical protein
MKKIKVTEQSGAFLEYSVADDKVDSFLESIPSLGHGQPERTVVNRDFETGEETTEIIPAEFTVEIEDVDMAEIEKSNAIAKERKKINYGLDVKAHLGYLCEVESFDPIKYSQMLSDETLQLANMLLLNGALETVRAMIFNYTPVDYFTLSMKSEILSILDKYIADSE